MRRVMAVAAAWLLTAGAAMAQTPATAKVEGGVIVGETTERARVFRNVPYAAPPVGPLRWAPPQRVDRKSVV